jgi:hypothetical protein
MPRLERTAVVCDRFVHYQRMRHQSHLSRNSAGSLVAVVPHLGVELEHGGAKAPHVTHHGQRQGQGTQYRHLARAAPVNSWWGSCVRRREAECLAQWSRPEAWHQQGRVSWAYQVPCLGSLVVCHAWLGGLPVRARWCITLVRGSASHVASFSEAARHQQWSSKPPSALKWLRWACSRLKERVRVCAGRRPRAPKHPLVPCNPTKHLQLRASILVLCVPKGALGAGESSRQRREVAFPHTSRLRNDASPWPYTN